MLTKSKYLAGLSCPAYLWMMFHDLDKIPENGAGSTYRMEQGILIGTLAKKLFPEGVDTPAEFNENLKATSSLILSRATIFEAGILSGELYARADVLVPSGDCWDVYEVKMSGSVKEEHYHDVAFQRHVYEKAGLRIGKCYLVHITSSYVRHGEIDPSHLFVIEDITDGVQSALIGIQERIDAMLALVASPTPPDVRLGNGCLNGLDCPSASCWSFLPEGHIFELYIGGKKRYELLEASVLALKDIPDGFTLNSKQSIQKQCALTGKPYVDSKKIAAFLSGLVHPIHYLDFESVNPGVPLYEGTSPFQQIPFQYSLHIEDSHYAYLHTGIDDPREKLLNQLSKDIRPTGSILVFNKSYEIGRLKEMALLYPSYAGWVESVIARIVDLIDPFKNFWYYHPLQRGSCSLKAVLPAVTGRDYSDLDIADGDTAAVMYIQSEFGNLEAGERAAIRDNLLKYCGRDTEGMVWILRKFQDN